MMVRACMYVRMWACMYVCWFVFAFRHAGDVLQSHTTQRDACLYTPKACRGQSGRGGCCADARGGVPPPKRRRGGALATPTALPRANADIGVPELRVRLRGSSAGIAGRGCGERVARWVRLMGGEEGAEKWARSPEQGGGSPRRCAEQASQAHQSVSVGLLRMKASACRQLCGRRAD